MSDRFEALVREARETGRTVTVPAEVVGELLTSPAPAEFAAAVKRLLESPGCSANELEGIRAGLLALAGEPCDG